MTTRKIKSRITTFTLLHLITNHRDKDKFPQENSFANHGYKNTTAACIVLVISKNDV